MGPGEVWALRNERGEVTYKELEEGILEIFEIEHVMSRRVNYGYSNTILASTSYSRV